MALTTLAVGAGKQQQHGPMMRLKPAVPPIAPLIIIVLFAVCNGSLALGEADAVTITVGGPVSWKKKTSSAAVIEIAELVLQHDVSCSQQ